MWSLTRPKGSHPKGARPEEAPPGLSRLRLSARSTAAACGALALVCAPLSATALAKPTAPRAATTSTGAAGSPGSPGAAASATSAALAAPLPGGLGPCVPGNCPGTFPPVNNGPIEYRDNAINVFVGDDFRVRERAAEVEGRVVVLGDFDQNKGTGGSSIYNLGEVGVGSRVAPPVGSDWLTTGGNVSVAPGQRLLAEDGVVRHAGTASGTINARQVVQDDAAVDPYRSLRGELTAASQCYAHPDGGLREPTGTVRNSGYETRFVGDGKSKLQVFNVDFDLTNASGGDQDISFGLIPDDATVLVNVLGDNRTISTYGGSLDDSHPFNQLRSRLLWNFPDATNVTIKGSGQMQGSFLIGNQASTSTVGVIGLNGRFFTTGSLVHNSGGGGGGQEFHAYPFEGDLPTCSDTNAMGEVRVKKIDAVTGAPLADAEFDLWEETNGESGLQTSGDTPDTRVGEPCTTDTSGKCGKTVPTGLYYWRETKAPAGYELPDPAVFGPFELTEANADQGVEVTVPDQPSEQVKGAVRVIKTDEKTGDPLPGAEFDLWQETNGESGLQTSGDTPDTRVGEPCTTDGRGVCRRTVSPGTYYWRETKAPEGYVLPYAAVFGPVEVKGSSSLEVATVTATNKRKPAPAPKGKIQIVKTDKTDGKPLGGAVFQLWRESNGRAGLQTSGARPDTKVGNGCATDSRGRCGFNDLPLGSYYLQETDVPEGYVLPANRVSGPYTLTADNASKGVTAHLSNKRGEPDKGGK